MKTNKQNKQDRPSTINHQPSTSCELQSRPEHPINGEKTESQTQTINHQQSTINRAERVLPYVNFEQREQNRSLSTDQVLDLLRQWLPEQFHLAEVVGKWIWITFPEPPAEKIRAQLSQFGFHWNNHRKCWQHPCGTTLNPRPSTLNPPIDPRQKYGSRQAIAA